MAQYRNRVQVLNAMSGSGVRFFSCGGPELEQEVRSRFTGLRQMRPPSSLDNAPAHRQTNSIAWNIVPVQTLEGPKYFSAECFSIPTPLSRTRTHSSPAS